MFHFVERNTGELRFARRESPILSAPALLRNLHSTAAVDPPTFAGDIIRAMNNPLDGLYKSMSKQLQSIRDDAAERADYWERRTAQTSEVDHKQAEDLARIAEYDLKNDRFETARKLFVSASRLTHDDETLSKKYRDKADGIAGMRT